MKKLLFICVLLLAQSALYAQTQYTVTTAQFDLPNQWAFGEVVGIVENTQGHKFVLNRGQHPLLEFDSQGNFVKELGQGEFSKPHGLRIDRHGNLWTTDTETHLVLRFAPSGEITMVLGMKNKASKGWFDRDYSLILFNSPHDVAFDKYDNIFVVDKGNDRIVKLNADGMLLKTWGQKGDEEGEFNFAHAIVIDQQDRILVADRENKRVQLFDLEGKFTSQWADVGYPYVMVLTGNSIWITDARNETIQQRDLDGKRIKTIQGKKGRGPGQFGFAHGLHVTQKEHIFVTQVLNWSVLKLIPTSEKSSAKTLMTINSY